MKLPANTSTIKIPPFARIVSVVWYPFRSKVGYRLNWLGSYELRSRRASGEFKSLGRPEFCTLNIDNTLEVWPTYGKNSIVRVTYEEPVKVKEI